MTILEQTKDQEHNSSETSSEMEKTEETSSPIEKLTAALFYGASSVAIMFINKRVLTQYKFPSFIFVAILQYIASIIILICQRRSLPPAKCSSGGAQRGSPVVQYPLFSISCITNVFPLSIVFVLNTLSGLGATKKLNMPLFVLLRRFSIVMTMLLEMYMLKKVFGTGVKISVLLMIIGALLTALVDTTYEWTGVVMILANDLFTALQGVGLRSKMEALSGKGRGTVSEDNDTGSERSPTLPILGTAGIMYYNNLISCSLAIVIFVVRTSEMSSVFSFEGWSDPEFCISLTASAFMGFVLNYAYYWCTKCNSPLTTTVIGSGKNIITSYVGMIFNDYRWNLLGFIGINISVCGTVYYNWLEILKAMVNDTTRDEEVKSADARTDSSVQSPRPTVGSGGVPQTGYHTVIYVADPHQTQTPPIWTR